MLELDELDHQLITALRANGRVSNREVARQLGVSEATVRTRLRRLEEGAALRIRAVSDVTQAGGAGAQAMIGITVAAGQLDAVMSKMLSHPQVILAVTTIGRHDAIVGVAFEDQHALNEFVLQVVNLCPGVERAVTYQAVKVVKHDFNWVRLVDGEGT